MSATVKEIKKVLEQGRALDRHYGLSLCGDSAMVADLDEAEVVAEWDITEEEFEELRALADNIVE